MKRYLLILPVFILCSCATQPHKYQPPSKVKLEASTGRLNRAVESSHVSARKAQESVSKASTLAKHAKSEVAKIKNVPAAVTQEMADLQMQLDDAQKSQAELEKQLSEADQAKAQVERDKAEYYSNAQKLADAATNENTKLVKAEHSLHWYRMHFFLGWIIFGLGVLACAVLAILKFTGRLML